MATDGSIPIRQIEGLEDALAGGTVTAAEVLMADGVTPPEPLTAEDETDWLYEG